MGAGRILVGKYLKTIFECAYLFLLVDQYEDGLWGKSITPKKKILFSSYEEVQIAEKRRQAKSISVTFFAVDGLYSFTKNLENPAIQRALNCFPNHKDNGSYGSFGELISAYPIPKYQIMTSCRHTATALLTYLLFQDRIDEDIIESVKFLIDHINKDGGWGVTADLENIDSDCLTTSYTVKLLTTIEKMGIKNFLPEIYLAKIDEVIASGLDWLRKNNEQNGGFWGFFNGGMKIQYSAVVLSTFPELKNYEKKLYEETLNLITSLQRENGGWTLSLREGRSELSSTIWVVSALVNSNRGKYTSVIESGIDFITKNISKWSYSKDLTAADWSILLKLAKYKNIYISHELDYEIQNLANIINKKVFDNADINFFQKKLSTRFQLVQEPILSILKKYHSDIQHRNFIIKMIDRTPRWVKYIITAIFLTILLGIISSYIYDLYFP